MNRRAPDGTRYWDYDVMHLYPGAIRQIMQEHHVQASQNPGHIVGATAGFTEVVQHTFHYLIDPDHNRNPHYRYALYRDILKPIEPSGRREAHIDIGCGAGLFSWAFLDWAKTNGLPYDSVVLYGLDHSEEMINLAHLVRDKLVQNIANYPDLHYTYDVSMFLRDLTENHRMTTDYTITFGHVLAQAHSDSAILNFAKVINHILGLLDDQSRCFLIAVDARNWSTEFTLGWDLLLERLEQWAIGQKPFQVPETSRIDNDRARIVELYAIG